MLTLNRSSFVAALLGAALLAPASAPAAAQVQITNSIVQGGFAGGSGLLDADPQFADPAGGDYRLTAGSPALDAGANSALPADATDLDNDGDTSEPLPLGLGGNPRVEDNDGDPATAAAVDLGAYEALPDVRLPVELTSFMATYYAPASSPGAVRLSWETASETQNAGFTVQRAAETDREGRATRWTDLGFVPGAGTTERPQAYRFTDELDALAGEGAPTFGAGALRYRLRQRDLDGSVELSDVVTVRLPAPPALDLEPPYPNPSRGAVTAVYALPAPGPVQVALYNALGQRVRLLADETRPAGRYALTPRLEGLPSGTYFLRLTTPSGTTVTRPLTLVR